MPVYSTRRTKTASDDPSSCRPQQRLSTLLQVMAPNRKIYALKRIKLQGRDAEAATGFIDEITLLQALRGKQNIIQLVDAEVPLPLRFAGHRLAYHDAWNMHITVSCASASWCR